ncbi:hypothetical protein KVT40_004585 [Elsinoe batatas]|uniref:rRNA-processing protein FYV7 n=1 Tax=Elsinoe batatas TaxID=2601811 RepID=A0A8K0L0Z9_9PEZI|nr:hypothetical protein KVT40_004585 [Elsinoe batatas]
MSGEKRKSSFSSAPTSSKRAKPSPSTSSQPTTSSAPAKSKKGISVGPANLPEGQWKRRNQRIKRSLVDKAKLRQDYRKLKTRLPSDEQAQGNELKYYAQAEADAAKERDEEDERVRRRMEGAEAADPSSGSEDDTTPANADDAPTPTLEVSNTPHPDRQAMMSRPASPPPLPAYDRDAARAERRQRRPKTVPFAKEQRAAEQRRKEAEERRERVERAHRERDEKAAERERFRRAMAKARTGGKNGQRKLGRESGVLLERVRRMMS